MGRCQARSVAALEGTAHMARIEKAYSSRQGGGTQRFGGNFEMASCTDGPGRSIGAPLELVASELGPHLIASETTAVGGGSEGWSGVCKQKIVMIVLRFGVCGRTTKVGLGQRRRGGEARGESCISDVA